MICPKCRSRAIGRIGQNQYYCWDCNIEFVPTKDGYRTYRLEADGTVVLDSIDGVPAGSPTATMSTADASESPASVAQPGPTESLATGATDKAEPAGTVNPVDPINPAQD